jgi:hypothetical protein
VSARGGILTEVGCSWEKKVFPPKYKHINTF